MKHQQRLKNLRIKLLQLSLFHQTALDEKVSMTIRNSIIGMHDVFCIHFSFLFKTLHELTRPAMGSLRVKLKSLVLIQLFKPHAPKSKGQNCDVYKLIGFVRSAVKFYSPSNQYIYL